LIVAHRGGVTA